MKGIITEIQRFSIHDGPGIRTTVFFKGCNMRCAWCHNPETLDIHPHIEIFPDKCIGCGECSRVCENGVHIFKNGEREFLREHCKACGKCAKACYAEALVMVGKEMTVEEVIEEVRQDMPYYKNSGGGITLSGGEFTLQKDFAYDLLKACKLEGINTGVESNISLSWKSIEPLLPLIDIVMMDIKIINNGLHKKWTGISNAVILENAKLMSETGKPLIVRTPVIPGINDNEKEIGEIAEFICGFQNLMYYELLPYNPIGKDKYDRLGMPYYIETLKRPDKEKMRSLSKTARAKDIKVVMEYDI
ncbi:MAG: glycyl-radical enzyme activating protein [Clostridia bacterium]|nr:glycyl-radical enzyme activating protein [Clostridia bacterium]